MKRDYTQLPRKNHTYKWVDHSLYVTWNNMKARCYDKSRPEYKNYGGRGVKICKAWRYDFEKFVSDMGDKPSEEHSIDRIDNNKNYKLSNCRWATDVEQAQNKRVYATNKTGYGGITKTESGGYKVRIVNTKINLGVFETLEEAIEAKGKNKKQTKPRLNNTTGVKGVTIDKKTGLFKVRKVIEGSRKVLGYCDTLLEAEKLYNSGVKKYRQINNDTNIRGINKLKNGTFRVRVTRDGVRVNLGVFKDIEGAKKVLNENS